MGAPLRSYLRGAPTFPRSPYPSHLRGEKGYPQESIMATIIKKINCAHIVLYDDLGRVALQQREDHIQDYPSIWGFFGGRCEGDETPLQAILREVKEETALALTAPRLIWQDKIIKKNDGVIIHFHRSFFMERWIDKRKLKLHEGQGYGWFRLKEAAALPMLTADRKVLAEVKQLKVLRVKG